jgi:hypothetical protein
MKIDIHNQYHDFKLQYLGSSNNGVYWNVDPDREVDIGNMSGVDLTPVMVAFEGAITYELERKHVKTGNRSQPTRILLFVAWESEGYKKFRVLVHLLEHDKQSYWRRSTLEEYYQRYANQFCTYTDPIKDTWLMPDGTVLATELRLDFTQRDGVLGVTISEGVGDAHTKRPEWFYPER